MPWRRQPAFGLARRFPVLAIRDFRYLLGDRLLAMGSIGFSPVDVSFAVLTTTGSPTDLSYVLTAQITPTLLFALVGGVPADRISPQAVLIAANLAILAGEGSFGILVLTIRPPLWAMVGLEALTGTGTAMFYPSSQALLPRVVPAAPAAGGKLVVPHGGMNTGQMAGAAVGGLVVAAVGPGWSLLLSALCVTGPVPLLPRISARPDAAPDPQAGRERPPSMLRELREVLGRVPVPYLAVGHGHPVRAPAARPAR